MQISRRTLVKILEYLAGNHDGEKIIRKLIQEDLGSVQKCYSYLSDKTKQSVDKAMNDFKINNEKIKKLT